MSTGSRDAGVVQVHLRGQEQVDAARWLLSRYHRDSRDITRMESRCGQYLFMYQQLSLKILECYRVLVITEGHPCCC